MSSFRLPVAPSVQQIGAHLETMKRAQLRAGPPPIELRKDRIERAIDMLSTHRDALVDAIRSDYGSRSRQQTLLADILTPIEGLRFNRDHLDEWMRAQPR
jgi:coniferyl-aldehyde dehydrogenase